ncbi:hypothetical protein EVAR_61641_1 [Eumeta japonica]|uniref:Uncharacterized protein n=1 Tax=Eumeta variegata TaxID=151549 RepID=A0A4C1Z537_EUMVA|nr:hypothetical protein EVAR_61641_1 [Eumeta japonica]
MLKTKPLIVENLKNANDPFKATHAQTLHSRSRPLAPPSDSCIAVLENCIGFLLCALNSPPAYTLSYNHPQTASRRCVLHWCVQRFLAGAQLNLKKQDHFEIAGGKRCRCCWQSRAVASGCNTKMRRLDVASPDKSARVRCSLFSIEFSRGKQACEPTGRWSPPPMDTRKSRRVTGQADDVVSATERSVRRALIIRVGLSPRTTGRRGECLQVTAVATLIIAALAAE